MTEQLKFQSGAFSIPHPEKALERGPCDEPCWSTYIYIHSLYYILYIYICVIKIEPELLFVSDSRTIHYLCYNICQYDF